MKTVAIIPARGGSVRIPRKNIKPFFDKPIMAYSIEVAQDSKLFDAIYVSTEDEEIAAEALRYGAQVIKRPGQLAEVDGAPDCGTQEVTRNAVAYLLMHGHDVRYACCIYPTAPFILPDDLAYGLQRLKDDGIDYVYATNQDGTKDAGQWYWSRVWPLLCRTPLSAHSRNTWKVRIPERRVCDINTEADWEEACVKYASILEANHSGASVA